MNENELTDDDVRRCDASVLAWSEDLYAIARHMQRSKDIHDDEIRAALDLVSSASQRHDITTVMLQAALSIAQLTKTDDQLADACGLTDSMPTTVFDALWESL